MRRWRSSCSTGCWWRTRRPTIVLGPGDVVVPWDPGVRWTACTPLRLALLGTPFSVALAAWPAAAARLLARAPADRRPRRLGQPRSGCSRCSGGSPRDGEPARRCRRAAAGLDVRAVSALLTLSEADVTRRWRGHVDGTLVRRDGPGWLLRTGRRARLSGHSRERRDHLRARGAQTTALARAIGAEFAAVMSRSGSPDEGSGRAGVGAAA